MERFEGHLGCRLADRLSSHGAASFTGLDSGTLVSLPDKLDESVELTLREVVEVPPEFGIVFLKSLDLGPDISKELLERLNKLSRNISDWASKNCPLHLLLNLLA